MGSSILKRGRLVLPAAVLAIGLIVSGLAIAHVGSGSSDDGAGTAPKVGPVSDDAMAAFERLCGTSGEGDLCSIVPGSEDPSDATQPIAERVAAHGTPASECPEAAAAYDEAGPPVDAFLGPCPSVAEVDERLAGIDPDESDARLERALELRDARPGR